MSNLDRLEDDFLNLDDDPIDSILLGRDELPRDVPVHVSVAGAGNAASLQFRLPAFKVDELVLPAQRVPPANISFPRMSVPVSALTEVLRIPVGTAVRTDIANDVTFVQGPVNDFLGSEGGSNLLSGMIRSLVEDEVNNAVVARFGRNVSAAFAGDDHLMSAPSSHLSRTLFFAKADQDLLPQPSDTTSIKSKQVPPSARTDSNSSHKQSLSVSSADTSSFSDSACDSESSEGPARLSASREPTVVPDSSANRNPETVTQESAIEVSAPVLNVSVPVSAPAVTVPEVAVPVPVPVPEVAAPAPVPVPEVAPASVRQTLEVNTVNSDGDSSSAASAVVISEPPTAAASVDLHVDTAPDPEESVAREIPPQPLEEPSASSPDETLPSHSDTDTDEEIQMLRIPTSVYDTALAGLRPIAPRRKGEKRTARKSAGRFNPPQQNPSRPRTSYSPDAVRGRKRSASSSRDARQKFARTNTPRLSNRDLPSRSRSTSRLRFGEPSVPTLSNRNDITGPDDPRFDPAVKGHLHRILDRYEEFVNAGMIKTPEHQFTAMHQAILYASGKIRHPLIVKVAVRELLLARFRHMNRFGLNGRRLGNGSVQNLSQQDIDALNVPATYIQGHRFYYEK
jgi:hypothetical protein